jgi:hypothetical protein
VRKNRNTRPVAVNRVAMNLDEAIASFTAWDRPWLFHDHVATYIGLSNTEVALFERVWDESVDKNYWVAVSDLAVGARQVAIALSKQFPALSSEAAEAVARAASYEWK